MAISAVMVSRTWSGSWWKYLRLGCGLLPVLLSSLGLGAAQTSAEHRRQLESLLHDFRPVEALRIGRRGLQLNPEDPALLILTGALEVRFGNREEGLRWIRQAVRQTEEPLLLMTAAEVEAELGHADEAMALWQRWRLAEPGSGKPGVRLAEQHFFAGQDQWALEAALDSVSRDPACLRCRRFLAVLLESSGRHDEALGQLYAAWRLNPEDPGLLSRAADAELGRGRPNQALELLELAASIDPENPLFPNRLAELWSAPRPGWQPDDGEAAAWRLKAAQMTEAFQSLGRAIAQVEAGDRDAAIAVLRETLAVTPEFATGAAYLGHLLQAAGRTAEAREVYAKVLEMRPGWKGAREEAAWIDLEAGRVDSAVELLQEARDNTPNLLLFEAYRLQLKGDWQGALALLRHMEQMYPLDLRVLRLIGHVLNRNGEPAQALAYLEKAFQLSPDPEILREAREIRYEFAVRLEEQGDWEGVMRTVSRLLSEDDQPHFRFRLAYAYQNLSRYTDAIAAYRRGLEQSPDVDWARSNLAWCHFALGEFEAAARQWIRLVDRQRLPEYTFNLGLTRLRQYREVEGWALVQESAAAGYPAAKELLASAGERLLRR